MRFLVHNQLPSALARYLSSRGVDCRHVIDDGLDQSSDAAIWAYASDNEFVLISKDADFLLWPALLLPGRS